MSTEGESRDSKEAEAARAEAARALDRIEENVYGKKKLDVEGLRKDTEVVRNSGFMDNPDVRESFQEIGRVPRVWMDVVGRLRTYDRALKAGKARSGVFLKTSNEDQVKRYLKLAEDLGIMGSPFLPIQVVGILNELKSKYLKEDTDQTPTSIRPTVSPVEFIPKPLPAEPEDETGDDGIPAEKRAEGLNLDELRIGLRDPQVTPGAIDNIVSQLKDIVEREPDNEAARRLLGDAYMKQGNFQGAINEYNLILLRRRSEAKEEVKSDFPQPQLLARETPEPDKLDTPLPPEPEEEEAIIPAEKRAEVEAIVGGWRKAQRRLDELGSMDSLFIDEKSQVENRERAGLRGQLEETQAKLSDLLDLPEDESYQNYLSLMKESELLVRLSVDPENMLAKVKGDSDLFTNRVDLLREVYAQSGNEELMKAFEQVVTTLQKSSELFRREVDLVFGKLFNQIYTDVRINPFPGDMSIGILEGMYLDNLLNGKEVTDVDEIVRSFRERNKGGISYYNSVIPRIMAIEDRFREYASKAGVEVVYNDQAGAVEIKKLTEADKEKKEKLLSLLKYDLETRGTSMAATYVGIAIENGYSAYEVAGILAGAENEETVDLVLTELRGKIPEGKYQELSEYIKIAKLKKAGKI